MAVIVIFELPFAVSLAPEEFKSNLMKKLADLGVEVIRDDIVVMGFGET